MTLTSIIYCSYFILLGDTNTLFVQVDFIHQRGKFNRDIRLANVSMIIVFNEFNIQLLHRGSRVKRPTYLFLPAPLVIQVLIKDDIQPMVVKLYDFGMSKDEVNDSAPRTQIGTALFTAPEVLINLERQSYDGKAVDVWSLGVVSKEETFLN